MGFPARLDQLLRFRVAAVPSRQVQAAALRAVLRANERCSTSTVSIQGQSLSADRHQFSLALFKITECTTTASSTTRSRACSSINGAKRTNNLLRRRRSRTVRQPQKWRRPLRRRRRTSCRRTTSTALCANSVLHRR